MDTTLQNLFKAQVSQPYDRFRECKNGLVNYLITNYNREFWNPTVETVKPYIRMTTDQENLNMVMFICTWSPTFYCVSKKWIECCIKAGISLDQKDIRGKTTQEYISEYLKN